MSILPIRRSAGNHDAPDPEEGLLRRWPHLRRPGPNWRAAERRSRGLPPELSPAEADEAAALVTDNAERLAEALWPALERRVRELIEGV